MLKLDIDETKAHHLHAIAAESGEALTAAAEDLEKSDSLLRKSDIREVLEKRVTDQAAIGLSDIAVSFGAFVNDNDADLDDVFSALIEGAEDANVEKEVINDLRDRIPIIKRICAIPRVSLIGKSIEIREAAGPRLLRSKVFTQSHPIFDGPREQIEGSIVTSSLHVDFINGRSESDHFEVTLTLRQLRNLQDEIGVAIKKAEAYTEFLSKAGLTWVLSYDRQS